MHALVLGGLLALGACSPKTVNTVQPGAIDKDALDGEWYWRRTVAEVPYGSAATFAGASDQLERIRWRIEEDHLLGYRSYPNVDDAGPSGLEEDGFFGAPLLVFRIERHFDIRRGYDRTTGEESNVIEENVERPWYEREYFRVDWSQNLTDVGFSLAGLDAQILGFATGDDRAEAAPQFDDSDGDGVIDSLLLQQSVMLQPNTRSLPGFGDVPVCLFYGRAQHECAATEVSVVHSFLHTEQRPPYEGLAYDDHHMETFGYFSTQRLAYDRAYGIVEPNRTRWANRHRLFEKTYARDSRGVLICKVGRNKAPCDEFDLSDDPKLVKLPMADRAPQPIVYHAGPGFPEDLKPVMAQVAEDWNRPLADSINGLRYWDCMDKEGQPGACEDLVDQELQAFVFCPNNPSKDGDPEVCNTDHTGPEGKPDGVPDLVRVGDLRYSLAHVFEEAQISSPFGYGPSAADPVGTVVELGSGERLHLGAGEIISGTAYVYGHVLDRVAHQVADVVQLLNGEVGTDAFVQGEDVQAWVDAVRNGQTSAMAGRTQGVSNLWDEAQVEQRLAHINNGFRHHLGALHGTPRPTSPASFESFMAHAGDSIVQSGAFGAGQAGARAAFDDLMASGFTDLMWTDDSIGMLGFDPHGTSVAELDGRSPLELVDPALEAEREAGWVLAGQHAVDLDDGAFTDSSMVGLARQYADRGLTYEEVVADVRAQMFRSVMLHEIGHTLGLRHNFAGSFDALNYRPEYWTLREADGTVRPRHVDPESQAEKDGGIQSFQYSSIMDYAGARNVGWAGLGRYDEAAIKFGYASLVEVFTSVPAAPVIEGLPNTTALAYLSSYNHSNVYPTVLLWYTDGSMVQMHYTQLPGIAGDLDARQDVPFSRLTSTLNDQGTFADGLVLAEGVGGLTAGMPAVPYRFCSDEFAVGITCARFDMGADPYEAHQFLFERYINDYVFNNFSRTRYGFGDAPSYVSRLQARTFRPLRNWERYYALFHGIFNADGDPNVAEYFAAENGFGGWTAATDDSFRFLLQVITRPEPGSYASTVRADGVSMLAPSPAGTYEVPLVAGAYYESEWDFDSGYHWFERQMRIGNYWDRMLAVLALTDTSSQSFLGFDTAIDPRTYAIGFQDLYRDELHTVLGELLADEVGLVAPARLADDTLVYPDPMQPEAEWPPADASLVQPAAYWLVRFNAGLFGKSLLNQGYDRTFLNRSRLYVQGTGDAPTPAPDQAVVTFEDPVSRKTWVAWSFPMTDADGVPGAGRWGTASGARQLGSAAATRIHPGCTMRHRSAGLRGARASVG